MFGLEHVDLVKEYVGKSDIKCLFFSPTPETQDLSPLIKRVEAEKVDALLNYGYPPHAFLINKQMRPWVTIRGFSRTAWAPQYASYRDAFGAAGVDGVFGTGPSLKDALPRSQRVFEGYKKMFNEDPRWRRAGRVRFPADPGAGDQKGGDLNREKIRDVIAKDTFDTIIGPMRLKKGSCPMAGDIGQWQKGCMKS